VKNLPLTVNKSQLNLPPIQDQRNWALNNWAKMSKSIHKWVCHHFKKKGQPNIILLPGYIVVFVGQLTLLGFRQ